MHSADRGSMAKLRLGLVISRMTLGVFFLVWSLEKIVAPEIAQRVAETFYGGAPGVNTLLLIGIAQTVLILAFMAGLMKTWTYGALLVFHTASVLTTVGRLINPYEPPNHLFWAGVPVIALLILLFLMRNEDTLFVLGRRAGLDTDANDGDLKP